MAKAASGSDSLIQLEESEPGFNLDFCLHAVGQIVAVMCLSALPAAALGERLIGEALRSLTLEASVVDADTHEPIAGVSLLARESTIVFPVLHFLTPYASSIYPQCFRGAFGQSDSRGAASVKLSPTGLGGWREFGASAYIGWTAYSPQYCIAGDADLRDGPYTQWPSQKPVFVLEEVIIASGSYEPVQIALHKSRDHGEARILYLTEVVKSLTCHFDHWNEDTLQVKHRMLDQIAAEAAAEATTDYDRQLVEKLRRTADAAKHTTSIPPPDPPLRVVRRYSADRRESSRQCLATIPEGASSRLTAREFELLCGGHFDPGRFVFPCDPVFRGSCETSARADGGATALMQALAEAITSKDRQDERQLVYIKALLLLGTDPNIARRPGERTVLDEILLTSLATPPSTLDWELKVLELLAQDGRATITRVDREQLETFEGNASVAREELRNFYRRAGELTRRLALRTELEPSCKLSIRVHAPR